MNVLLSTLVSDGNIFNVIDGNASGMLFTAFIGLLAGCFASYALNGRGLGLIGNTVLGLIGAALGRWMFEAISVSALSELGYSGDFIYGVIGSTLILFVFGRFGRD